MNRSSSVGDGNPAWRTNTFALEPGYACGVMAPVAIVDMVMMMREEKKHEMKI